jgi:copper chaperone CopZ
MTGTKRFLPGLLLLVLVTTAACSPPHDRSPELERTVFTVTGMHCDSCNAAIAGTLQGTVGVLEASADYTKGEAVAVYRPKLVSAGALEAAIEKLGYTVTAVSTTPVESASL